MNKYIFSIILIFGFLITGFSQTKDMGRPVSWGGKIKPIKSFYELPKVDVKEQLRIDSINKANGFDKFHRFGYGHEVEIDVFKEGKIEYTQKGDKITQYGVYCPSALSINLVFDHFELADGVALHLFSEDHQSYVGAHTSLNNNKIKRLGTDFIMNEKMIIEVVEPKDVIGQSSLLLGTIVHGYRDVEQFGDEIMKSLNSSADCNIDVNCPQGAGWEKQRNSVAMILVTTGFCSGSLVNNTSGEIKPYLLTALHCGRSKVESSVFRFRWETPEEDVSCATTDPSTNGPENMNINGGVHLASNNNSDFLLIELNSEPDPDWEIYYNGWDNSDEATITRSTGIHHPRGDVKKICHSEMAPTKESFNFNGNSNAQMWRVNNWTEGVTQTASSGSPLFDQNKRLVGVLSGGTAACNGTSPNDGWDVYGRFGVAWDAEPDPENQLKHWLDPGETNVTVMGGIDPAVGLYENDVAIIGNKGMQSVVCGGETIPSIMVRNSGSEPLTSFDISYSYNEGDSIEESWSGFMEAGDSEEITLNKMKTIPGLNLVNVKLSNPNGLMDQDSLNNVLNTSFASSSSDSVLYTLEIITDCYASETSWEFRDTSGMLWYSGGNYTDNMVEHDTLTYNFCLAKTCYDLTIFDEWGDGFEGSTQAECNFDGSMSLINDMNGEVVAAINEEEGNVDFEFEISFEVCSNLDTMNHPTIEDLDLIIYPNPSDGIFMVALPSGVAEKKLFIHSIEGKLVNQYKTSENHLEINENQLRKGVYILTLQTDKGRVNKKFVVR